MLTSYPINLCPNSTVKRLDFELWACISILIQQRNSCSIFFYYNIILFLWRNLFWRTQFPGLYYFIFQCAKVLFCFLRWIFSPLDFLKQDSFVQPFICSKVSGNLCDWVHFNKAASFYLTKFELRRRYSMSTSKSFKPMAGKYFLFPGRFCSY